MSLGHVEERPRKKRRFFVDDAPVADKTLDADVSLPDEPNALPQTFPDPQEVKEEDDTAYQNGSAVYQKENPDGSHKGFDIDTFTSVVGEAVPPATIERLRSIAGGNLERGIVFPCYSQ